MTDPTLLSLLSAAIETVLAEALTFDPGTRNKLQKLDGKILCLEISDFNFRITLRFNDDSPSVSIQPLSTEPEEGIDISLSGALSDFAKLAKTSNHSLADSGVTASGSVGMLSTLQEVFSDIDIDWEDALTQKLQPILSKFDALPNTQLVTGPIGLAIKKTTGSISKIAQNSMTQISEFIQHESGLVVNEREFQEFSRELRRVRQGSDRLEAKLRAFQTTHTNNKNSTDIKGQ